MSIPPQLGSSNVNVPPLRPAEIAPSGIKIPSIGVDDHQFIQVGMNSKRELEVPPLSEPLTVAWYKRSPIPGDVATCSYAAGCVGSTVVLAHVNGGGHEGAFAKLAQVKTGASVAVERSDGQTAMFTVYRVMVFQKSDFPTQAVYGDTTSPELRLITCGPNGLNRQTHSYSAQTVVLAKLTSLAPTTN